MNISKLAFILTIFLNSNIFAFNQLLNSVQQFYQHHSPYQDIVVNNVVLYETWNSIYCQKRYEIIRDIIYKYGSCTDKKLHLLDIGAAQGYFSFRLAHDFEIKATLVEDGQSASDAEPSASIKLLEDLCNLNGGSGDFTVLPSKTDAYELDKLSAYKRFDVVLALSVVHHIREWQNFIDSLKSVGDLIIIELPIPGLGDHSNMLAHDELVKIHEYILSIEGQAVASTSRFYKGQMSSFYIL